MQLLTLIMVGIFHLIVSETETDWDTVSYVLSSDPRVAVLETLSEGVATPSELADQTEHEIAHTSRALGELRKKKLVDLKVSEDRKKGRLYGVTEKGQEIQQALEER